MILTIRAFGIAREICGGSLLEMDVPDLVTAEHLKELLKEKFPRLGGLNAFLLAVNEEFAEAATPITEKDEIAIIPPVSGG